MRVKINAVRFKADKKLEDFIKEKVNKLASTYDNIIASDITLKVSNGNPETNKVSEIRLSIPGNDLFAKKQSKTFEEATDSSIDALKKQLQKYKAKI